MIRFLKIPFHYSNYIIIFSIIALIYIPFYLYGDFGAGDDEYLIEISKNNNHNYKRIIDQYNHSTMISRPFSLITRSVLLSIFEDNAKYYFLMNIIVWVISMVGFSLVLKNYVGDKSHIIFLLLSPFPIFCSSIISSSYLVIEYGIPVLLSSIFCVIMLFYTKTKNVIVYILGYLCCFSALLFSPIIYPLLMLGASLPIINYFNHQYFKISMGNFLLIIKYYLPLLIIFLIIIINKLYIVPEFTNGLIYSVNEINKISFIKYIYFIYVIILEPLILIFKSILFFSSLKFLIILILLISTFYYLLFKLNYQNNLIKLKVINNNRSVNILYLYLTIILFISGLVFFISGQPSVTFGWYNRLLVPSFIIYCLIISNIICYFLKNNKILLPIIFSVLWINSMNIQIGNFIETSALRRIIYLDINNKIKVDTNSKATIIASVPFYLEPNYNNEHIVYANEFFTSGFNNTTGKNYLIYPFSWRSEFDNNSYISFPKIPNYNKLNYSHLWFYRFDPSTNISGEIFKIHNQLELLSHINFIKSSNYNYHPPILREFLLNLFRHYGFVIV